MNIIDRLSNRCLHFFHVVSNVRPIVWIGLYVIVTPIFALIYWLLPEGQFRIPDENPMDYGSCLYYSIVTITTLGFGDYTPTHGWSQAVTACEVMCGLIVLGLFLNAVGSMKSEIDVTSALEKQRLLHYSQEKEKLMNNIPIIIHHLNNFLRNCYVATTPTGAIDTAEPVYNPDFTEVDMSDAFKPGANGGRTAAQDVGDRARMTSLFLDSLQNRVDITLWPELLEDFFSFVANEQMFEVEPKDLKTSAATEDRTRLADFIRKNASIAMSIESALSQMALEK